MSDLIARRAGVHCGAPCIAGTRIPVATLVACRVGGWDDARILASYPGLTAEQLEAAFAYGAEGAEEGAASPESRLNLRCCNHGPCADDDWHREQAARY